MLNTNLQKIRKERGLTQEALAVKLNVVRQTISKWEQGTAVPDADTLCRIAEALDIPVTDLLGVPVTKERDDVSAITKSLAEINEQLAIKNRRSHRIWKIVGITLLIFTIAILVLFALNIVAFNSYKTSNDISVQISENDIPLFESISQLDDGEINDFLIDIIYRDQLIETWGQPDKSIDQTDYWKIDEQWTLKITYDENDMVISCGKEN